MKVLIVEDQESKFKDIQDCIHEISPCEVFLATSFVDARDKLFASTYDWVILDMTIPFEGSGDVSGQHDIEPLGGRLLLREAAMHGWNCNVVVVTQYPVLDPGGERVSIADLKKEAETLFESNYRGTVYYQKGELNWRNELINILKNSK